MDSTDVNLFLLNFSFLFNNLYYVSKLTQENSKLTISHFFFNQKVTQNQENYMITKIHIFV